MATSRRETLKNMLEHDPAHQFARFGLAMDYVGTGELSEAVAEFERLLQHDPNYVAGYFHGGQALEKLGRADEARQMYQRGLTACTRVGDAHTRSEIQAALDLL